MQHSAPLRDRNIDFLNNRLVVLKEAKRLAFNDNDPTNETENTYIIKKCRSEMSALLRFKMIDQILHMNLLTNENKHNLKLLTVKP